jgi:hypothetical protein
MPVSRLLGLIALCLFLVPSLHADPVSGKVLRQSWYERRCEQGKLGFLHLSVLEVEVDGKKLIRTTLRDTMKYIRSGDPYAETTEQYCVEDAQGKVFEVGYRTTLGKKQDLIVRGKPEGERITLHVYDQEGKKIIYSQQVPWNPAAIGLYAQDRILEGKKLTKGDKITFIQFSPHLNRAVPTIYTVKEPKKLTIGGTERELVEVTQSYPKELYLDKETLWVDTVMGRIVKYEQESTLFGMVFHELASEEDAKADFKAKVKDVEAPVTISKKIAFKGGPPKELRVRVTMANEEEMGTVFVYDGRQLLLKDDKKAVELRLLAKPEKEAQDPKPGPDCLASNFYVRSDSPEVIKLAKKVVGDETDPRRMARKMMFWVHHNVKGDYEVAFATADEVARTLEGDCTEMGILFAAMCRAVGIPSRVAFGLVYDDQNPGFGGHLWTEVYVEGRWEVMDATRVLPTVGAAYIKIDHFSMADLLNPEELTTIRRAFGHKMKVEVLEKEDQ